MRIFRLLLCSFLGLSLTPLFIGCNSDEIFDTGIQTHLVWRENAGNPYDETGMLFSRIYHDYKSIHSDSVYDINRIITEVEKIIEQSAIYSELAGTYTPIDPIIIRDVILNPDVSIDECIYQLDWDYTVQQFGLLLYNILQVNMSSDEVYASLIEFETQILQNSDLSMDVKEKLLSCCSIMRYDLDNGDDRDWNDQNGNIVKAVLMGMKENTSKAIVMAVVVQVFIRQQTEDKVPDEMSP